MSLFDELKRRNVFRVAVAYLVIGWLVVQVIGVLLPMFDVSAGFQRGVVLLLAVGFIPALFFSWAFELTPEGIKKEKDVVRDDAVANIASKRLNIVTVVAALGVAVMFGWQQFNPTVVDSSNSSQAVKVDTSAQQTSSAIQSSPSDVVSDKSIAVLPFANMANNPENEPFTVGLHDDLLTHLSKISALKVISRTSVMEYKDTTKKIKDIAGELGVANILEGGVQRAGNQIRLNVQLIDAKTDEHLWAEIYDEELTTANIFSIQTKISKQIAAALKAQLTTQESESIEAVPTDNLEAYDAYLAGRQLIEKREGNSLKQALALFQKATELDPDYALAYVGQALALRLLNEYSDLPFAEMLMQGEPLVAKALALDPLLAEAHASKASYLAHRQQYQEAEKSYLYALRLNPNDARTYHHYGHLLRNDLGRYEEALELHRKGAQLDPLSRVILANVGWSLRGANQIEEARQQFLRIHQLYPDYPGAVNGLAWVNDDVGNYAQAVIQQNKAVVLDTGNILNRSWLIRHYLNLGDVVAAKTELEKAKKIAPEHDLYAFIDSRFDMLVGNFAGAQQRFTTALEADPDNNILQAELARISVLNGDCAISISMWQSTSPEMFAEDLSIGTDRLYDHIDLAWCLKQTGQEQTANNLLTKIQQHVSSIPDENNWRLFTQAGILAVQGKPAQAAQAYADRVASKRTRNWYWLDHLPYFADTRIEPVFIEARKQLMQDLQVQRDLLADYQALERQP